MPFQISAVGQHHFQAQHQIAGIAVAERHGAAGIGGDVAADLAGAFSTQAEREQAVHIGRCLLERLEHAAGFDRDGVVERVHLADLVHP